MPNCNTIIVGFSKPNGWFEPFSWLIRLVTWSAFSHAYIRYYDAYAGRWVIYQASGLKVNFMGQTMFDSAEDIYAEFEVSILDATKQGVVQKAIDKVGSPYGIGQIVGFGWVLFMRLFGKTVANPLYSPSSFVCSELVSDILIEINAGNLDPSTMTPKDVYNFILSKGYIAIN
jgi:hypothetical protein